MDSNSFYRDLYNVEVVDQHFMNEELFSVLDETKPIFKIDQISGKEKVTKTIRVQPKESREHIFEPATFSYQTQKGENA